MSFIIFSDKSFISFSEILWRWSFNSIFSSPDNSSFKPKWILISEEIEPFIFTIPIVGSNILAKILSKEVFPDPFGPYNPYIPFFISRFISERAST